MKEHPRDTYIKRPIVACHGGDTVALPRGAEVSPSLSAFVAIHVTLVVVRLSFDRPCVELAIVDGHRMVENRLARAAVIDPFASLGVVYPEVQIAVVGLTACDTRVVLNREVESTAGFRVEFG